MNHLSNSLSPYLLQHAGNPVDWHPWGDESLARAKRERRPIFLSIGYSACHWCHVMERESFENREIAALLNQTFVAIKVDREERPDIDRVYMKAVQLLTGRGGWPLSVFLTPDLAPFYGGTYFPPDDRSGMPGFRRVVTEIARLWKEDPQRLLGGSRQLLQHLESTDKVGQSTLDRRPIHAAVRELGGQFDEENGGFGGAPKFPPAGAIELLLREHARTGQDNLLRMVRGTLDGMARGGIYDHLGGGFHRYAVDDQWLVPHFEKMLYDNALLARSYLDGWLVAREPRYRQVAAETLDFVLREMTDPAGGFHSSLDADSEGVEGKCYVWTQEEIAEILPASEAEPFASIYGVTASGNFEGSNILNRLRPSDESETRLAACRTKLLRARELRIPPQKDDKILTAWNGLMIAALTQGYRVLGDRRHREAAERSADFLLRTMHTPDGLLRVYRNGQTRTRALLDDYAYLGDALLDLFALTGTARWLQAARTLAEQMLATFGDPAGGGFFYSPAGDPELIVRERCFLDEARPSPNAVAARLLLRLSRLLDADSLRQHAEHALAAAIAFGQRFPTALAHTWCVLDEFLATPEELVIVGDGQAPERQAMREVATQHYAPNRTLLFADGPAADIPILQGRQPIDGKPTAHLCRDRVCSTPVITADELRALLG